MEVHPGDPVLVPFGRGIKKAYVLTLSEAVDYPEENIKDISSLCEK